MLPTKNRKWYYVWHYKAIIVQLFHVLIMHSFLFSGVDAQFFTEYLAPVYRVFANKEGEFGFM